MKTKNGTCLDVILFFFFFQAEDGIRDDLVTGVQTCALPISRCGRCCITSIAAPQTVRRPQRGFSGGGSLTSLKPCYRQSMTCLGLGNAIRPRSEERRVGKECRSRRATYQ